MSGWRVAGALLSQARKWYGLAGVLLVLLAASSLGSQSGSLRDEAPRSPSGIFTSPLSQPAYFFFSGMLKEAVKALVGFHPETSSSRGPPEVARRPETHLRNAIPFNLDDSVASQNEETITIRSTDVNEIVGGANDFRLLSNRLDFQRCPGASGFYVSINGGSSVVRDGCLPPVAFENQMLLGLGDPVLDSDNFGNAFYSDLRDADNLTGVGITRSLPSLFRPSGTPAPYWDTTKLVVAERSFEGSLAVMDDKEWIAVDKTTGLQNSGMVYATWTRFQGLALGSNGSSCLHGLPPCLANIYVSRCLNDLSFCTTPQPISTGGPDELVSGSIVAVDPTGKLVVVWRELSHNSFGAPVPLRILMRVCDPSPTFNISTDCGSIITVRVSSFFDFRIPYVGYRTPSIPTMAIGRPHGVSRVYIAWQECSNMAQVDSLHVFCQDVDVFVQRFGPPECPSGGGSCTLSAIDSGPRNIKQNSEGQQYFPSLSTDSSSPNVVNIVWYDTAADPTGRRYQVFWAHSKDGGIRFPRVEALTPPTDPNLDILSSPGGNPNDPDLDILRPFIGDYFQAASMSHTIYVHYTANFLRKGPGEEFFNTDNFLAKISY